MWGWCRNAPSFPLNAHAVAQQGALAQKCSPIWILALREREWAAAAARSDLGSNHRRDHSRFQSTWALLLSNSLSPFFCSLYSTSSQMRQCWAATKMGSALPTPLFCKGGCRWGNGSLSGCVLRSRGEGERVLQGCTETGSNGSRTGRPYFYGVSDTLLGKCCVKSTNKCSREELTRSRPVSWPIVIGSAYKANGPCLPYQRERETPELASWEFLIDALCHPSPHSGLIEKLFSSFTFYFSLFLFFVWSTAVQFKSLEPLKWPIPNKLPKKGEKKNGMFTRPWGLSIFWMTE